VASEAEGREITLHAPRPTLFSTTRPSSTGEKLLLYKLVRGAPKETFLILVAHREDWAICCPAS